MQIIINGQKKEMAGPVNVQEYLRQQGIITEGLVVEINQAIIKQSEWADREIKENDVIELISFVGGDNG
jgi:sulfur carrier protein